MLKTIAMEFRIVPYVSASKDVTNKVTPYLRPLHNLEWYKWLAYE